MAAPNNVVLYNYDFSPFGKRISTYLALRGIQYAVCDQPMVMPRPDLALLPLSYRRIPILAIGRDIYLDTRLILSKLETLFPASPSPLLGATNASDRFTTALLQKYMIEGPVFGIAAGLVPVEVAQDETFAKDRKGFMGRDWSKEELEGGRGECLAYVRGLFGLLEGVFGDGREWVVGGEGPSLADVEGTCSVSSNQVGFEVVRRFRVRWWFPDLVLASHYGRTCCFGLGGGCTSFVVLPDRDRSIGGHCSMSPAALFGEWLMLTIADPEDALHPSPYKHSQEEQANSWQQSGHSSSSATSRYLTRLSLRSSSQKSSLGLRGTRKLVKGQRPPRPSQQFSKDRLQQTTSIKPNTPSRVALLIKTTHLD